jgi:hypothetical protein
MAALGFPVNVFLVRPARDDTAQSRGLAAMINGGAIEQANNRRIFAGGHTVTAPLSLWLLAARRFKESQ